MPHLKLAPDKVVSLSKTTKMFLNTGKTVLTGKVLTKVSKPLKKKKNNKKVKMKR